MFAANVAHLISLKHVKRVIMSASLARGKDFHVRISNLNLILAPIGIASKGLSI